MLPMPSKFMPGSARSAISVSTARWPVLTFLHGAVAHIRLLVLL